MWETNHKGVSVILGKRQNEQGGRAISFRAQMILRAVQMQPVDDPDGIGARRGGGASLNETHASPSGGWESVL